MSFTPRTINQIYSTIITEKSTFTSLTGLTSSVVDLPTLLSELDSNSSVALWSLWAYIDAVSIWTMEQNMQNAINDVEISKSTASVGNLQWYNQQALLFQYGDILSINPITFKPYYPIIDTSKQIIQNCTSVEQFGYLILKVRKLTSNILSSAEMIAFMSYLHQIKFVGTKLQVINTNSDKLKLYFDVYFNSQEILSDVKTAVEGIINTYVETLQFDSVLKTNAIIDKLQTLPYINDVQFTTLYGRKDTDVVFQPFTWTYNSYAGYADIDSSFPLSGTINYIAL